MNKSVAHVFAQFNPLKFKELSEKQFWQVVEHVSKVLLIAVIVLFIGLLPSMFRLSGYFDAQLEKFNALSLEGNISVKEPVYIPAKKTQLVVDTTGAHSHLGSERFLITNEGLMYYWFNEERMMSAEEFQFPLKNKEKISAFLTMFSFFLLPSFFFLTYGFFWIKYMITILLFGTVFYVILDLTHFRLSWRQMIKVAGYSSAPMILLEVISIAINTDYLIPLVQIVGMNVYLLPLLVYIVVLSAATTCIHVKKQKE